MPQVISPSAFMTGNAPGGVSYAAPLVNFSQLSQLPQDYYAGTQMKRNLALQNAFPDGLPTIKDANGNDVLDQNGQPQIDVQGATNTLTRIGGAEAAQALLPQLMRQQSARTVASMLQPQGEAAPPSGYGSPRAVSGPNAGPANITGGQPSAPSQPQQGPQQPVAQEGDAPSIRIMATEFFGSQTDVGGLIDYYSGQAKIDPDRPLTAQQQQQFRTWAGQVQGAMSRRAQAGTRNEDPSSSGAPTSGTSAQDRQINGVNAAPPAMGGTSGAPAPVPSQPRVAQVTPPVTGGPVPGGPVPGMPSAAPGPGPQPQQPQPLQQPPAGLPGPNSAAAAIMPGSGPQMQRVQQLRMEAQRLQAAGAYLDSLYGAGSGKGYLDAAGAKNKEADQFVEALRGGATLTEQQKNVLDPRVQAAALEQKRQEGLQAAGQKAYEGINANARSYETQQKGWLDTARALFSQPELYTGVGSNMSQFVNRVKAAFANDPKGAEYQAVLGKVNAANILNTINQQKFDMLETGSNAGRIFAGQIDQAEKTSPGVENTIEANRALIELQTRVGKMNSEFARQARDYLTTHPYLDAGFDAKLSKWVEQHPLLSQAEISNPSLLGVPYIPPDRNSPEKVVAWAGRMGLKEGDPIRTADGRLGRVPRIHIPAPTQNVQGVAPANAAAP